MTALRRSLSISLLALVMAPASAHARDYHYFCGFLPPNTWCMAAERHTYGLNAASLPSGTTHNKYICSKLIAPSTPSTSTRVCVRSLCSCT